MKKLSYLFLFFLIVGSLNVYAQEEDAGVTPDSPLWGLDRALERIELLLANGDVEEAKIQLKHAHERLLEVKVMIEQNKLEQAEKAREAHREKIEEIKVKIRDMDSGDDDAVENEVELENEIEDQEDEIEDVEKELEIKIKGQITPEQQAAIDALIESFKDSTNEMRIEIKIKRDEIKVKIKERTGKDDDEVEDEFEEHQNRTINSERALEQINDAEEELLDAKEDAREVLGENTGNWSANINSLFREAEIKLTNARAAFNEGKYGEAYGQANAAEKLAENIEKILDKEDDKDKKYIGLGDECDTIQFQCAIGFRPFEDDKGCGCKEVDDDDNNDRIDCGLAANVGKEECKDYSGPPQYKDEDDVCDEISGKIFRSVKQYEVGLAPQESGNVLAMGYWRISFDQDGKFTWGHSDVVENGSYVCDGDVIIGTSTGGRKLTGEYDDDENILVWQDIEYIRE